MLVSDLDTWKRHLAVSTALPTRFELHTDVVDRI